MNKPDSLDLAAVHAARDRAQHADADPAEFGHPLEEAIPLFRRWPRSIWRDLVYTLILNTFIAALFMLFALSSTPFTSVQQFLQVAFDDWIVSNVIGFTFHFVSMLLGPRVLGRISGLPFWALLACNTAIGVVIVQSGFVAALLLPGFSEKLLPGFDAMAGGMRFAQWAITSIATSFVVSVILGLAWRARVQRLQREAMAARERERLQTIERQVLQANLRALQAQIEPHFLFNTLANVDGLIHSQPDKARQMLEQFVVYLRTTLAANRAEQTTLAREFETLRHFLGILQIRMEVRLAVHIDLPAELAGMPIPPMLIQPLVENAIRHGLEPKIEGGAISLSARRSGRQVTIVIADTGVGFGDATSGGIGLRNVRDRLRQLYGDAAWLDVEDNLPCGARVTLSLPA